MRGAWELPPTHPGVPVFPWDGAGPPRGQLWGSQPLAVRERRAGDGAGDPWALQHPYLPQPRFPRVPPCPPVPPVLTMGLAGARSHDAEPCGAHAVAGHVLLRLEEDDVELGREEAAEDHSAAEAHRDAHGCGLHLEAVAEGWASGVQQRPAEGLLPPWGHATLQNESLGAPLATAPTPPGLLTLSRRPCVQPTSLRPLGPGSSTHGGPSSALLQTLPAL